MKAPAKEEEDLVSMFKIGSPVVSKADSIVESEG